MIGQAGSALGRAAERARRVFVAVLPPAPADERVSLREPVRLLPLLAAVLLLLVFGRYLWQWILAHWEFLFEANAQTDDARTVLFPFHRYGAEGTLADDPIAREMMGFSPPLWWLLYRLLVPVFDIFVATKIVQGICLAIVGWSVWILARSRRGGLAAGVLLAFMLLHTQFITGRIGGGLPRAFAFPLFAVWSAGAIVGSIRVRALSAALGGLLYPTTMVLILGAEGLLTLFGEERGEVGRAAPRRAWVRVAGRLARYAVIVAACFLLVAPYLARSDVGTVHTLEQAEAEPAFRTRLGILPFADPIKEFPRHFISPLNDPRGQRSTIGYEVLQHGSTGPLVLIALLLLLPALRLSPAPRAALAFFCSAVVCYAIARVYAFRLYSPERYYSFGMPMACVLLIVGTMGRVGIDRLRGWWAAPARNLIVAAFISLVVTLTGNGFVRNNMMMPAMPPRGRALIARIKALPKDARIAAHPKDADDIPLWAGRAATGGYETLQPWLVKPWRRAKKRTQQTLEALYATDVAVIARFVERYRVSHMLLNTDRYGPLWRFRARVFEPFDTYLRGLFRDRRKEELLLARLPEQSVIYSVSRYRLVDVKRLLPALRERQDALRAGPSLPAPAGGTVVAPATVKARAKATAGD